MAYTVVNFKTKKELKEAIARFHERKANPSAFKNTLYGRDVRCYNPGLGPDLSNYTGKVCLEGPHYPQPHRWYAKAEMVDGIVVKVS